MIPTTENEGYGFYGTMNHHAEVAWPIAMRQIAATTGETFAAIRAFLDSARGRHFADAVIDRIPDRRVNRNEMSDAIRRAIRQYPELRRDVREMARQERAWRK